MLTGIYGLLSACLFVVLDAVDVAITEAAVGAGISTILMLTTLATTGRYEMKIPKLQARVGLALVLATGALLIYGSLDMSYFGSEGNPANDHVAIYYIQNTAEQVGVPNLVTAVLASYRGYDTFGELVVIFTAGVAVLALLAGQVGKTVTDDHEPMRHHLILRITSKMLIPLILLFALYVQFHGDFGPGGGFQAGIIFAAAIILYSMVFGLAVAQRVVSLAIVRFCAALGVLLYAAVGVTSMLYGETFLNYSALSENPIAGQHVGILLIELGVGITVAAVMISVFYTFTGSAAEQDSPSISNANNNTKERAQ